MNRRGSVKFNYWNFCDKMPLISLLFLFFIPVLSTSVSTQVYKVGVLMASRLDSPFDLERCGPAVDLALDKVNEKFLSHHGIELQKVQGRWVICIVFITFNPGKKFRRSENVKLFFLNFSYLDHIMLTNESFYFQLYFLWISKFCLFITFSYNAKVAAV